jgi:hypothetical protein
LTLLRVRASHLANDRTKVDTIHGGRWWLLVCLAFRLVGVSVGII